jgi:hypothetical protein
MSAVAFETTEIRALQQNGALVRDYRAGGTITVGNLVYVASDGDVEAADADSSSAATATIGIAVCGLDGETTISSGDPCAVCVFGPVSGFSGMTPGDVLWVSDTVGRVDTVAGTFDRAIGYAERAGVIFVNPQINDPSSA